MTKINNHSANDIPDTLEQRIASALSDASIGAGKLAELVTEVAKGIVDADVIHTRLQQCAFDPVASPDAAKALEAVQFAEFVVKRLRAVLPRLQAKQKKVSDAEDYAAWLQRFEAIKPTHAVAAAKLKRVYQHERQLIDSLTEAQQIDAEVQAVADAKPWDNPHCNGDRKNLLSVECAARGLTSVPSNYSLMQMKIPTFSDPAQLSWPPPTVPLALQMATPILPGPGRDWHAALAERDAERRQENARVAAYYANQQKAREDRENAEARAAKSAHLRNGGTP